MTRCGYKARVLDIEWACPLDALPGEEYCYWHKEEDGKEPTEAQLGELKGRVICDVYLKKAKLAEADLQGVSLPRANFQKADLRKTNLRGARLIYADLQKSNLIGANLQKSNLSGTYLQGSNLFSAEIQESNLFQANLKNTWLTFANFQKSYLLGANLQGSDLAYANLNKTNMREANIQGSNLMHTNVHETDLISADLQGSNLYGAKFNSQTVLDNSILIGANLFHSYFDEAKSFRNTTVFQNVGDREINEIAGDTLACGFVRILETVIKHPVNIIIYLIYVVLNKVSKKKPCSPLFLKPSLLDIRVIEKENPNVTGNLRGEGLIRYVGGVSRIIFFDPSSRYVIKNPENTRRDERSLTRVDELNDIILKDGKIRSESLYMGSRAKLYEASYEVYNNLYNFYIANGRLDQAAHAHYRRGEAHRKLRWVRGGWTNWTGLKYKIRSIFDLVILNLFTGYGDRVSRPIIWSGIIIGAFAALFWHFDGIVKNVNVISINGTSNDTVMYVNGSPATPDWVDYLYHSITTFTSLGYSNIQPNLAAG
ncbi:MAG: pentapeptide repeat-containing protein, partial [Methanosarcinales archaeon]|nr:pentapeptide repeat-containing protein [Methanosarcinales archaeon]